MNEAGRRWFLLERMSHFLFFGDRNRVITKDEKVMFANKKREKEMRKRRDRNRWSPYQAVQFMIQQNIGACLPP